MWRKRTSNWLSNIRGKGARWANRNPKAMIAGMFCIMVLGITWLLAAQPRAEDGYFNSMNRIYSKISRGQGQRPEQAVTADIIEMWRLYSRVHTIDPDSLSPKDSAFLKDIDQQLNSIIHE